MESSGLKSTRSLPGDHGPGVAHVVLDVEGAVVPHEARVAATPGGVGRAHTVAPPGRDSTAARALRQRAVRGGEARLAGTDTRHSVTFAVSGTIVGTGRGEIAGTESIHHVVGVGVQQYQHGA